MLQIVDAQWKDHLYSLDHLKEGIGLRGYGQRDPLVEYKKESFALFQDMKAASRKRSSATSSGCARCSTSSRRARAAWPAGAAPRHAAHDEQPGRGVGARLRRRAVGASRQARRRAARAAPARTGGDDVLKTVRRDEPKVGRNDPCPCGSGKKYKKCHGSGAPDDRGVAWN